MATFRATELEAVVKNTKPVTSGIRAQVKLNNESYCNDDHRDAVETRIEERRNVVAPIRGKLKERDKSRARETSSIRSLMVLMSFWRLLNNSSECCKTISLVSLKLSKATLNW